jgi:hypothetical protein
LLDYQGASNVTRVYVVVLGATRFAPKDGETTKDDGLSQTRFCRSIWAEMLFSSASNDRQQADSSTKVSRVLRWTTSFYCS